MFSLLRAALGAVFALVVLIPAGIVLAAIGLPVAAVVALIGLPLLLVLFLIGLPVLVLFAVAAGLIGATIGVVAAFLAVGVVALKWVIVILIPLLIVAWLGRRVFGPPAARGALPLD